MKRDELVFKMALNNSGLRQLSPLQQLEIAEDMLQIVLDNIGHIVETYEVDQIGSFIKLKEEFKKG